MEIKDIAKIFGVSEKEILTLFGKSPYVFTIKPVVLFDRPIEKLQENVFMQVPPERTAHTYRYVIQLHLRGLQVI